MKRSIALMLFLAGTLSVSFLVLDETRAVAGVDTTSYDRANEVRVNANLLRVKAFGSWHEVPLIPLSENTCKTRHPLYRRYCE